MAVSAQGVEASFRSVPVAMVLGEGNTHIDVERSEMAGMQAASRRLGNEVGTHGVEAWRLGLAALGWI